MRTVEDLIPFLDRELENLAQHLGPLDAQSVVRVLALEPSADADVALDIYSRTLE